MNGYDYFQNTQCPWFPCHAGADRENFNCLFCYCPLYCLGFRCGGSFRYTDDGIKDCPACLFPHRRENYGAVCQRLDAVLELVRKAGE